MRPRLFCVVLALAIGACSREHTHLDRIAKALVERRASLNDAETALGVPVRHIYTRDEVAGYYAKTRLDDRTVRRTWERMMAHPETLYFGIGSDQLDLFVDDAGRITSYYLTSQ